LFTISFPFAFTLTLALSGLAFTLPIALPLSFENASFTVTVAFTVSLTVTVAVAVKGGVTGRPSHEWIGIWESGPGGGGRKTGGARANVDAEIGGDASCALAGRHEFRPETSYFLFVLLAYFSMLSLEVIEALTNDVEFINLAGNWVEKVKDRKLEE
jgi:hypothetical protein